MLKLKEIKKTYDVGDLKVEALKGINVEFRKNEFVAILGPSGCGKTTLLNIIGGLDKYDSGDLIIDGTSTKEFKDRDWDTYRNHRVGFVFQSYNLIPHQTVLKNVELALTLSGVSKEERKKRAIEALVKVGLEDQLKKKPNQMSGGQMQRVAIARAIVNKPEIILADEPTGALDSETSLQVMNILKDLSKETLVVMVTHNPELANKYASRIINVLDGQMLNDSNPFNEDDRLKELELKKQNKVEENTDKKEKKLKKYTSMSFWTAFSLSINNLFTKKGRTFLTMFAGSIGIIGISLVMAVSHGFQAYIDKVQSDTLSSYPLIIAEDSMNYEAMLNYTPEELEKYPKAQKIYINQLQNLMASMVKSNEITEEYIENVIEKIPNNLLNAVSYAYKMKMPIYKDYTIGGGMKVGLNINQISEPYMGSGLFAELLSNKDFVEDQYDIIYGNYPKEANEVILVVDKYNRISDMVIQALGITDDIIHTEDDGTQTIDFDKIVQTEFKMISNNLLYEKVYDGNEIKKFNKTEGLLNYGGNQFKYVSKDIYDNPENITLKISGIMRLNEDSTTGLMGQLSVIGYLPELTDLIFDLNQSSEIVKFQQDHPDLDPLTGYPYKEDTKETDYKNFMLSTGGLKIPNSVSIYPKDFSTKEEIKVYLNEENSLLNKKAKDLYYLELGKNKSIDLDILPEANLTEQELNEFYTNLGYKYSTPTEKEKANLIGDEAEIKYTDVMAVMVSAISTVIDSISYVLIAFTSISLIVSSIMIGIITYISVLERTKEIGILRAVGARKKDITRLFNAETFIIGLSSGIFGVLVTLLLSIPINLLLKSLVGVSSIASLAFGQGLIVIVISFTLTLIAGLIPSKIASKKDPVLSLRSE